MASSRKGPTPTTGKLTRQSQQSIHEFGRIAKPQSATVSGTKRKAVEYHVAQETAEQGRQGAQKKRRQTSDFEDRAAEGFGKTTVKRRRLGADKPKEPVIAEEKVVVRHNSGRNAELGQAASQPSVKKRKSCAEDSADRHIEATMTSDIKPCTPRPKRRRLASPTFETPTRGASALFDALTLTHRTNTPPLSSSLLTSDETPPTSPASAEDNDSHTLPSELQQLIKLHYSFLAALSIHHAHNGSSSPLDLGVLLPSVSKIWGKRTVNVDDIRRILGIVRGNGQATMQKTRASFELHLYDYGHGKTYLDIKKPGSSGDSGIMVIDENHMNSLFERKLHSTWTQWQSASTTVRDHGVDPATFIKQLPLAEVTPYSSLRKPKQPLFAKGQKRLEELKAGLSKTSIPNTDSLLKSEPQTSKPNNRGLALLERIRAKQLLQSSAPNAPSQASLARKAALHRLADIVAVLALVATGAGRKSFSMPMLVQQIQGSLRNPLSREDVERCLRVLAEEVAPGYVSIVRSGQVTGVVVDPGKRIGMAVLASRVEAALEG